MSYGFSSSTRLLVVLLLATLILYGCGTPKTEVRPDPASVPLAVSKSCPKATLWDIQPISTCATCPYMGREFATTLEKNAIFSKVIYVTEKPEMSEDILLKATFESTHDPNLGGMIGKAVFTGLFILLPAPFIWYEEYYNLTGLIQIDTVEGLSGEIKGKTTGVKLRQVYSDVGKGLGTEAMGKARNVLFRQLSQQLAQYCQGL